jgi:hypothetical protein
MHRGVSNSVHNISDIGQDLTQINKKYPPLWELLASQGKKVGVFGSLQSYPLPDNLSKFSFFVPDTFASGPQTFPTYLSSFQSFNLSMVGKSGRNVQAGFDLKEAFNFLLGAPNMGLTFKTVKKLTYQVLSERVNNDRLVRRRTSQIEIAFDLYIKQLNVSLPGISFFFTNHVASSMHRYWPTIFPEEYEEGTFNDNWLSRWSKEIPHAMSVANSQLERLIKFCYENNARLLVASSMGQGAVKNPIPINNQLWINDIKALFSYLRIPDKAWEPRLGMAPVVIIKPLVKNFEDMLKPLNDIEINGHKISYNVVSSGEVRFDFSLENIDKVTVLDKNVLIDSKIIGINNFKIQDESGSYAYHIPQGVLIEYIPNKMKIQNKISHWQEVSALDFAPSLIRAHCGNLPAYMTGNSQLFL